MNLKNIAAVSGKSGLYKVVKPTRSGVILEALDESKKRWVANASHRVSILREISVYITGETSSILLEDLFLLINEKFGEKLPVSSKSTNAELFQFIADVLPNYDREKVYSSDIKKMISWYQLVAEFGSDVDELETENETISENV